MKNSRGRAGFAAVALAVASGASAADVGITIPKGTVVDVVLENVLSSRTARVGDLFHAPLAQALFIDGELALPETTVVEGRVTARTAPSGAASHGFLGVRFVFLTLPGAEAKNRMAIEAKLTGTHKDLLRRSGGSATRVSTAGPVDEPDPQARSGMSTMEVELAAGTILSMEFEEALVVPRRKSGSPAEGAQP